MIYTKVVGVTFDDRQNNLKEIRNNIQTSVVELRREPENEFDQNAIAVYGIVNGKEYKIGYISRRIAEWLSPKIDQGSRPVVVYLPKNGGITGDETKGQNLGCNLRIYY